jgi:tetratricopeptide (TPR) repeat protein
MRPILTTIRALLAALLLAAPMPAVGADYGDAAALDELFAQLKTAPSADDANAIVAQIWMLWFAPGIPDLSDRMHRAGVASSRGDVSSALTVLSSIVTDYPDYAEGWNQRATLYYEMGNYDASLADIAKVLELEPRHFGALSGRVLIYLKQGKRDAALEDMRAALEIDPYLSAKELFPELAPNVTHV